MFGIPAYLPFVFYVPHIQSQIIHMEITDLNLAISGNMESDYWVGNLGHFLVTLSTRVNYCEPNYTRESINYNSPAKFIHATT